MSPPGAAPGTVGTEGLRACMRLFPTGVALLTAGSGESATGMSVNSVISVSLTPPLVLVSVHHAARINRRLLDDRVFALSFLTAEQTGLTRTFAAADRPVGAMAVNVLGGVLKDSGVPFAAGASATIECVLQRAVPVEDHVLVIGRVTAARLNPVLAPPQVSYQGTFTTVRQAGQPEKPEKKEHADG
ncbi:flavin reductase family protein [Streptomyces iconiensis]|uniref:Flavin reductase family protein n=1 Tax=Streptomyces iconiensis TaxID=1384038 RepID=A0ABT6ZNE0_9ACTN|nr:flavin reductase family protein [Streptomyces iconiensis]MDJ1130553.1 flavin reductase family protein [Streptomyces iconiensis]